MPSTSAFFRDRSILITGASTGIGEELALQISRAGGKLTLLARRRDLLQQVAVSAASRGSSSKPLVIEGDVTVDGNVEQAVAQAVIQWGRLDVVIANAGFGLVGRFRELSIEDYRRQLEVNVFGVLRTLYAALPQLEQNGGTAVIVGSVAGWIASPGASPYAMSKFALRALANAITPELRRVGVKVVLISPGFVVSNFRKVDNRNRPRLQARETAPSWILVPTDKAVRAILRAVAQGRREAIITGHGKALFAIQRFAPWLLRFAQRNVGRGRENPSGAT